MYVGRSFLIFETVRVSDLRLVSVQFVRESLCRSLSFMCIYIILHTYMHT